MSEAAEEYQPVTITVDYAFILLQKALAAAVDTHGHESKAFAWDVKQYFLKEIGHLRTGYQPHLERTDHE